MHEVNKHLWLIALLLASCGSGNTGNFFEIKDIGIGYKIALSDEADQNFIDHYLFLKKVQRMSPDKKEQMIKELLTYEGDKRNGCMVVCYNKNLSQLYMGKTKFSTVEIEALFLINLIYFDNPFYYSPFLILADSEGQEIQHNDLAIRDIYKSYRDWYKKVEEIGIEKSKKNALSPLDWSEYRWLYGIDISPTQPLQFEI